MTSPYLPLGDKVPAEQATAPRALTCDMDRECRSDVTHIDDKGYVYCTTHGLERRDWRPCRKLRGWELRRLQSGRTLTKY